MTKRRVIEATIALCCVVVLAACGGSGGQATKSGEVATKTTVLRLQDVSAVDPERDYLVKEVSQVSHGTVKLEIDSSDAYDSTNPANEARLVRDLRSGKVDFGYLTGRDFAAAGSTEFQAVDAPFVITTSDATQQFATSALASKYLGSLSSLGVVGVGIVPDEPRGFTTRQPLITASDFDGERIRIVDNPETAGMVKALGAEPVQGLLSTQVGPKLRAGTVDGIESSPTNVSGNGYQAFAPYTTSYALFPKLDVLAASTSAWSKLSATDQGYLKQAVADTVRDSAQVPTRERQSLSVLCKSGMVIDKPPASEFAAIVQRAEAGTPQAAGVRADIAAIRSAVPDAGPNLVMTDLPPECKIADSAAAALAAHHQIVSAAFHHRGGSTIPNGTYVTTTTVADFRHGDVFGPDWNKPITWTWHLNNGKIYETQKPDYPDQGPCRATYVTHGDELVLTYTQNCTGVETTRWSFYQGKLSFDVVNVADSTSRVIYTAHPWQKVS